MEVVVCVYNMIIVQQAILMGMYHSMIDQPIKQAYRTRLLFQEIWACKLNLVRITKFAKYFIWSLTFLCCFNLTNNLSSSSPDSGENYYVDSICSILF